jgi:AcrR family transcriptional regulator
MATQGLREQKKQATRRHIADVATMMFATRGFDNVTVAEIAEAANVSKMTVFNYFPRKEDLFLDRHADRIADLEQVIGEAGPDESLAAVMRAYHHRLLAEQHPLSGVIEGAVPFWRILMDSPALVNRAHEQTHEIQEAITTALVARNGEQTRSRLVAGLLTATVGTVFDIAIRRMLDGDAVEDIRRDQVGVIDDAFDLLERGIGDYGVRPA